MYKYLACWSWPSSSPPRVLDSHLAATILVRVHFIICSDLSIFPQVFLVLVLFLFPSLVSPSQPPKHSFVLPASLTAGLSPNCPRRVESIRRLFRHRLGKSVTCPTVRPHSATAVLTHPGHRRHEIRVQKAWPCHKSGIHVVDSPTLVSCKNPDTARANVIFNSSTNSLSLDRTTWLERSVGAARATT